MRDGVTLRANILLPSLEGRFPVLVYRTPYGKDQALGQWNTFDKAVDRGYAVVIQDVRGRYESEGEFDPYKNEGRDGYDTIEWAAAQPWSNGSVGTFGLSYPGAVQWLAALENPPHLKAMVPAMTFSTPRNFFTPAGSSMVPGSIGSGSTSRPIFANAKIWPDPEHAPKWLPFGSRNTGACRSSCRWLNFPI